MFPSLKELHLQSCELHHFPQSLPSSVNFTSLSVLDLSRNNFSSPIPNWLFNISTLEIVNLKLCELSGSIPEVPQGNLCNLHEFYISDNDISGGIKEFLDRLSGCNNATLKVLDMSSNRLGGILPDSLGHFNYLENLELSENSFLGPLPLSIRNLSLLALNALELYNNSWNDVITENHLQNLTKLYELSLSCTSGSLVFNVGHDWIAPFYLYSLIINDCQLGPAFPYWLRTQTQLYELFLSNASISDAIPDWFWRLLPQIWRLDLSHNQLRGELPKSIIVDVRAEINLGFNHLEGSPPVSWSNVTSLSLRNNLLSGTIPLNIGQEMPILENLDLSRNLLIGSIPQSISEMGNLYFLDLSSNHLSGEIPSNWQGLKGLTFIDLSNNTFSGGIPSSICSLPSLRWLKLNSNNLSGELSISLQNCSISLFGLDLGENKFFGTIPVSDGLLFVSYLGLRANKLTGNIPEQLCQSPYLQILDLAQNNLSGRIPKCLGSLEGMADAGFYTEPLHSIRVIDFSEHIEVVVKGRRNEYASIIFLLNVIDLSGNNLMGQIPSGNQFNTWTDPSIYEGNAYLCGAPLTTNCSSRYGDPEDKNELEVEDEDGSERFWFYVSMAMGFIVGFWAVCGTLTIKKSWRHAYFRFVDEIKDKLFVTIAVYVAWLERKVFTCQKIKVVANERYD
ncbi:hypothetical protein ACOSQ2_019001 [Xanthoceras sorbifolium]